MNIRAIFHSTLSLFATLTKQKAKIAYEFHEDHILVLS